MNWHVRQLRRKPRKLSNLYSVPRACAFETVGVQATPHEIAIVWKGEVVARHGRSYGRHEQAPDPAWGTFAIPLATEYSHAASSFSSIAGTLPRHRSGFKGPRGQPAAEKGEYYDHKCH